MSNDAFDLDAYVRRIAYDGPRSPSLAVLADLIACHTAAIPFENIDVFLGRPIPIDAASVAAKLIDARRGGYCFEQNTLLLSALTALGFRANPRLARVVRGMAADAPTPRTHMMLAVDLPEGTYLADVGFGNLTPTAPLALARDDAQATRHEPFRIQPLGPEHLVQVEIGGLWQTLYRVSPELPLPADLEVANWFTATNPAAPFVNNLIVARPGQSVRHTLFNTRVALRGMDGQSQIRAVGSLEEYRAELTDGFGLSLPAADLDAIATKVTQRSATDQGSSFFP